MSQESAQCSSGSSWSSFRSDGRAPEGSLGERSGHASVGKIGQHPLQADVPLVTGQRVTFRTCDRVA